MTDELKRVFERIKQFPSLEILTREGREFSFTDLKKKVQVGLSALNDLEHHPEFWDELPLQTQVGIQAAAVNFIAACIDLEIFNPEGEADPNKKKSELADKITGQYMQLHRHLLPALKIHIVSVQSSQEKLSNLARKAEEVLDELERNKSESARILKAQSEAAVNTGVGTFSKVFDHQAKKNFWAAMGWLVVSLIGFIAAVKYLWLIYQQFESHMASGIQSGTAIQFFLSKVILVSLFSILLYQLLRSYSANMHLSSLNRHRANCLKTFESFQEGSKEPRIRDAVLLQAARAIFDAGDTGFLSAEGGARSGIDVVRFPEK